MYTLNPNAARDFDKIGNYLSETGKYVGQFTRAEKLISTNKGTHGIGFTFVSQGQSARFDLWTLSAQNEPLRGMNAVNAIMACLRLKSLSVAQAQVERYDYDSKQTIKVQAEVFPELMGKDIGLVLQKTEYEKMRDGYKTGETGWRLELVLPFEAASELTASEILDRKTEPKKLPTVIATLADRPLKPGTTSAASPNTGHTSTHSGPPTGHPAAYDFDDIPL